MLSGICLAEPDCFALLRRARNDGNQVECLSVNSRQRPVLIPYGAGATPETARTLEMPVAKRACVASRAER